MKKRIDWIDVAKGLLIILVIVGHAFPEDRLIRAIIYSFHIPAFFILSGITFSPASDVRELRRKTFRDFKQLIIPVLFSVLLMAFAAFIKNGTINIEVYAKMLLWSTAKGFDNVVAIGPIWFFVSLFFSRLIANMVSIQFGKDKYNIIQLVIGITGIIIGFKGYHFIFSLDVAMASMLYFGIGQLYKKYQNPINNVIGYAILPCVLYWLYHMTYKTTWIDVGGRLYSNMGEAIAVSLCGSLIFFIFANAISNNKYIKTFGRSIGRCTLLILIAHNLDYLFEQLWIGKNIILQLLIRFLCISFLFVAMFALINGPRKIVEKTLKRIIAKNMAKYNLINSEGIEN
ncbi:acyltransferase family protein [Candidatus Saccharibacteria bacterium]|nr:acyltransferase family protein [Candidatus Saccharibacteria bacterium]